MIYVVDSDQVAKLHVLKTAPNSYIYSHLLYGIQSSSDIVQDPTRVSRTVCVWLNVSTTPGKGAYMHRSGYLQGAGVISTSDAKLGELFLKHVLKVFDAFCFCNLIWDDVPQATCRQGRFRAGMPKSATYGTRNWALPFFLLAGACMMWSNARMSTRP